MLSDEQVTQYSRDGYVLVADLLEPDTLDTLRTVTDEIVSGAAGIDAHTDALDLQSCIASRHCGPGWRPSRRACRCRRHFTRGPSTRISAISNPDISLFWGMVAKRSAEIEKS